QKPTDTGDAVEARLKARVPVKAGVHVVTAAFVHEPQIAGAGRLQRYERSTVDNFDWSGQPHIQTLTINGPFDSTGPRDTTSRRRICTCRPANSSAELSCGRRIVSTLARRAYRQPLTDADLQRLMSFFEAGRRTGGFEAGIQAALQRMLVSPQFLF